MRLPLLVGFLAAADVVLHVLAVPSGALSAQQTLLAAPDRLPIDAEDEANGALCGSPDFASHSRDAKQWAADHGWQSNCEPPCTLIRPVESACPIGQTSLLDQGNASDLVQAAATAWADRGAEATLPQFRGKVLRIRAPVRDGFWVRALFVIYQATWAAAHKIPAFVELNVNGAPCGDAEHACAYEVAQPVSACVNRTNCDAYYDPALNASSWEQYFKPLGGVAPSTIYSTVGEDAILEFDHVAGWLQDILQMPVYPESLAKASTNRRHRATTLASWIVPTDAVRAEADRQWNDNVLRGATTAPLVLGVHMRGTDKYIGAGKIGPEQYFPLIDAYLAANEGAGKGSVKIYLATDDSGYEAALLAKYGDRVSQQVGVERASGNDAVWMAHSAEGSHRRGLNVLLDTLMLAKCDYLLKSNSAVSEFALYFNANLITNSYDFSLPDRKQPFWAATA